jgi:3-hydroxyisobutyrate dehydrogenase-like beta-hydroxyacid dehydrogenase
MAQGATVGILHPGEMGAALAAQARRGGARVLWCPIGRSQASRDRATRAGLHAVDDLGELLERAEVVLSVCPPAAAAHVATLVCEHSYRGLYVEANATSPQRCIRIAQRLIGAGAEVLDGAIFGTPPQDDSTTKTAIYLAGRRADIETVAQLFEGTSVEALGLEGGVGAASALKMAHSGYHKTTAVLAAVAHALAARYGVTDALIAEARLSQRSPLAEPDQLPSVAAQAWRWTPELHEIADSLEAEELPRDLALAAAAILFRWHDDKNNGLLSLETILSRLADPT